MSIRLQRIAQLAGCLCSAALAQDPIKISSTDYKVEIDNDVVRVLRVKHPPHAKIAMHQHPDSVGVAISDVREKLTAPDGTSRIVDIKAGSASYSPASKHAEENLSDQPMEAVLIELKSGYPKSPPVSLDPVKLDGPHHIVLLENDRVRAIKTILEPHVKAPMHEHPRYVVVYLTGLHTTMKQGDGRVIDNIRKPGELAWRDFTKHETVQEGDQTAMEIQVEVK